MAIEAHLAVHGTLPCNVKFLLEGEEEIGSPQIADFVRTHAERLAADLVVTADGPLHASGTGRRHIRRARHGVVRAAAPERRCATRIRATSAA